MREDQTAGIGHNEPPLEARIFSDPKVTVPAVLEAVTRHIGTQTAGTYAAVSTKAAALASNTKRLPKELDAKTAQAALELIAALDLHTEDVEAAKAESVVPAKALLDALTASAKPLEAGHADLVKKLRPLLAAYVTSLLDAHNADLADGQEPMRTWMLRSPSGARATITDGEEIAVTDTDLVPREYLVPDMKAIAAAAKEGKEIPGTGMVRAAALRVLSK